MDAVISGENLRADSVSSVTSTYFAHLTFGETRGGDTLAKPARMPVSTCGKPVPCVVEVISQLQVVDVHTSMSAGTFIACVQDQISARVAIRHFPDHPSCRGGFSSPPHCGPLAASSNEDAILSGRAGGGLEFSQSLVPRGSDDYAPVSMSDEALKVEVAEPSSDMTSNAPVSDFVHRRTGGSLFHVAPLTQVRPCPGVVSATAGAFSYQSIQGIDLPLNRDRGVN